MSQPEQSPILTPTDSEITHEQSASPVTAPSDDAESVHEAPSSSSVTAASDHSDDTDDTASTQEEPPSPVTAPSDHSDDADTSSDAADPKASTSEAEVKKARPLNKVQELAAWYDSQANGNLRLQVLTWDGRAIDAPKNESKKSKKSEKSAQE